jgi:amino acid adenylation domain-containing protein/thioester reductase-like protein/non-ribosomal peptide synthase protein (TIGR01720 family)
LQPVPVGVPGELHIGGAGLARGYLNRPELTQEKFIPNPFDNSKLYKTGDLARYLPDGNIEFLGRIDHQVKIRGFRIELGEVEAALNHNPDVQTSCVIAREDIPGQKRLVAYVVPHQHCKVAISELRQYLKEKLPEYMMPHAFVILESLPLTPNGKVDRRALPAPDSRAGSEVSFVLPRNQTEKILAQIWAEVLRVKQVGIYDNFFELGGDSILSIQILAKAKQAGLQLTLKQLFASQTIAQLAGVAGTVKTIEVKQEIVTGTLPLTPIQHWFFEQKFPERHHFNQALLLSLPLDIKPQLLKQVFQHLLVNHDGLRLRFTQPTNHQSPIIQTYSAPTDNIPFSEIDLSSLPEKEQKAAIDAQVAFFQGSLNLSENLVQIVFFHLGNQKRSQLLVSIHHLAIDGVSWRILLEDLQRAYQQIDQGQVITLPAKTTAFKDWAEKLTVYARFLRSASLSQTLQSEAAYWLKETRAGVSSISVDYTKGVNNVAAASTILLSLTEAETRALLQDVPKAYNTQINDVLLTALALVLSKWTNSKNVLFNLEGHGREDIVDGVDLSRTIGWFTTIFPVVIELPTTNNLGDALKAVKEQLRAIPNKGIGYGILRYLSLDSEIVKQLKALPQAQISFNYLGQFDQQINTSSWIQLATESLGNMHGLQNNRPYLLEIDSILGEDRLRIEWTYSKNFHQHTTIENLAQEFVKTLQDIIAHTALPESKGHTPSDFPLVKLNQLQLDQLLTSLGKNNGCNVEDIYPLSPMQQGILFESLYASNSQVYFEQLIYSLSGNVNVRVFEQAWQQVIARHSVLRTTFVEQLDYPLQVVYRQVDVKLQVYDWSSLSAQAVQQELESLLQSQIQKCFNLSVARLMNFTLIKLSADRYQFVWNFHHVLLDGWSVQLIIQDLLSFYEAILNGENRILPPALSYRNYISWLEAQDLIQSQAFWRQKLQGFTVPTPLTVDKLSSKRKQLDSSYIEKQLQLTAQETESLQTFARQYQITMNNLVQGAWALLLSRYSQESDIVFGVTVSGRPPSLTGVESMVGLFINTLPVRVSIYPQTEVLTLLKDLQIQQVDSEQYFYSSLVDIQGMSDVPRGMSLFDSLVVFENYPVQEAALENNYGFSIDNLRGVEQTNYPLTIIVIPGKQLLVRIIYDISRFDDFAIARLLGHFQTLLTGIVANPKAQISQLPLLTEVEKYQLLTEWNHTQTEYPLDKCIHQLFEEQAELTPHAIAVECGDQQLTYYELNSRANQLAHYLQSLGVKPDVLVGICVERSLEMVVGILGILKAGGAYVPLDPEYPTERLAFMLENAQVSVLLTQQSLLDRLPQHQAKIVCLDTDTQVISQLNQENPISAVQTHNLVYVVYTSGSTGKPKGVAMNHLPLCNLILWQLENTTVAQDAKTLQFAPISFDVSFQEIFSTWCSGGTLVLITEELRRDALALLGFLEEKTVTRLFVPFVALQQLAEVAVDSELFATHLQEIITAGEQLQITPAISQWFRKLGNCTLHNHYGPSESHVVTAFTLSPPVETWPLLPPIGKAIANTEIYLLDQNLQPVPIGIPGELYIGGITLARGYLNRPDLTNEKFIPNPFNHPKSKIQNPKLYKTGDLARYLPDGNIEYLGRVDTQVKIRGFRIELGEVEAALSQYEDVEGCCVIAREDTPGNKRLVAYVVAHQNYTPTVSALRQFLKAKLPDYMIPSAFVILESFPLTPSGKVDRRALPAPDLESTLLEKYVAPRTPIEELLTQIWAQVLKVEQVGIDDNFFELGGHSLIATQLVSRIRNIFQVELPLYELFTAPTVEELAYIIGQLQQENLELSAPPLLPRAKNSDLPMSFAQQRLWFLEQFDQKSVLYNLPTALRLVGSLQIAALEQSLQTIIHRHEALRTNFITIDRQPTQVIQEQGIGNREQGTGSREQGAGSREQEIENSELGIVSVINLKHLPITEQEITVEQLGQQQIIEPFDLRTEALIRVQLVLLNDTEQVLLVCMHHIVADGWSMGVFVQELTQLYNAYSQGQSSPLTPLSIQYADFAIWQRQWLQGDVLQSQLSYWEQQLKDAPDVLSLPTDRPRPAVQTVVGATHEFALSVELTDKLIKLSQNQGCTLFMTLLAAYDTLLYRYTGQSDILVGSPIANRDRSEIEGLIGFFVNTLVMRTNLAGNPRFSELLTRVREMSLGAYAHQHLPFEMLVEALQPERDLSHTPLFQVMFNLQNTPVSDLELNGLTVSSVPFKGVTAAFDMTLFMQNTGNGLVGVWEYNTDLFDHSTIERVIGHFVTLLEAVVNNPQERIDQLPILTAVEQQKLLVEWNDTQVDYPVGKCLHHLFEQQVELTPDAIAVVFDDQQLTYEQLNTQANQLAHYLQSLGVKSENLVGIYLERSLSMTVVLLAVLKAGGGYVPLDIDYPQQRLTYISEDSQISVLITQESLLNSLPVEGVKVIVLDQECDGSTSLTNQVFNSHSPENPVSEVVPENLACVLYTSGSTGKPKGVMLTHAALVNHSSAISEEFGLTSSDLVLQFAAFGFDVALEEIFPTWFKGGTVVLRPTQMFSSFANFAQFIEQQQITVLTLTSAYWHEWMVAVSQSYATVPQSLRLLTVGGDTVLPETVAMWQQFVGDRITCLNAYGPTEASVTAIVYDVQNYQSEKTNTVLIGRPVANTEIYILDSNLQPVPIGVKGELYIGGERLARGYLNRPELTQEKFISHPFNNPKSQIQNPKLYKTGDLARYLPDGNIEFIGRIDDVVKIRGFRVALGEIESLLVQHPDVICQVVILREDQPGHKQLVAYVVSDNPSLTQNELQSFLKQKLPNYMIPTAFVMLEALPLTTNGKVDRRALPAPSHDIDLTNFVLPNTPTQKLIADIWSSVLGTTQLGIHNNFFDMGGNSLRAMQVMSLLRETLQIDLPLRYLFENPTVAELAAGFDSLLTSQRDNITTSSLDLTAEAVLDASIHIRKDFIYNVSTDDKNKPQRIFLTGVTGFLGSHLLYELLQQTQKPIIYCLIRATDFEQAQQKLQSQLKFYQLWSEIDRERIIPVVGDLGKNYLGLSTSEFQKLASQIDVIYHCGAWINIIYPYSVLKPANVLGTQEIIRLASEIKVKPLHFISTTSVLSASSPNEAGLILESDPLEQYQTLDNGYIQSKWVAEKLVMQARDLGLPVAIYRASRITGNTQTGISNTDDLFCRLVKGCLEMRVVPDMQMEDNLTPVDYVSKMIVHLSGQKESLGKAFHLVNPKSTKIKDLFNLIRSLGYPIQMIPVEQWHSEISLHNQMSDTDNLRVLSHIIPKVGVENSHEPQIDYENTINGVGNIDLMYPALDQKLLKTYISYFISSGFIDEQLVTEPMVFGNRTN